MWPFRRKRPPTMEESPGETYIYEVRAPALKRLLMSMPELDGIENELPPEEDNLETVQVLSLLPPSGGFEVGLPAQAVMGYFLGERFVRNQAYVDFMHGVVEELSQHDPGMKAGAAQEGEGWLYVIDVRTPDPQGDIPAEDIIGAFEVKDGIIVPGSYTRSEGHRIFTGNGRSRLPRPVEKLLISRLMAIGRKIENER